jgi:hypothetical protein
VEKEIFVDTGWKGYLEAIMEEKYLLASVEDQDL